MRVDTALTVMSEYTRRRRCLFRRGSLPAGPLCRAPSSFSVTFSSPAAVDGGRLARLAADSDSYRGFQNMRNVTSISFTKASRTASGQCQCGGGEFAESPWLCSLPSSTPLYEHVFDHTVKSLFTRKSFDLVARPGRAGASRRARDPTNS